MANTKSKLLQRPMNQWGFGDAFDKYFIQGIMDESQVLTLEQLFTRNPSLRDGIIKGVHCIPEGVVVIGREKLLKTRLKPFKDLVKILDYHGFTSSDWIMLLPKKKGGRPDYAQLDHKQLLGLPVFQATGVPANSKPMGNMVRLFFGEERRGYQILVKEILSLTSKDVSKKLGDRTKNNKNVFCTLEKIQAKFREFDLNRYPFMKVQLP